MSLPETSSLDDALARILGAPAAAAQAAVNLAPDTGLTYGGLDWGGLTNASTTQAGAPDTGGIVTNEAVAASPAEAAATPTGLGEGKAALTYEQQLRNDLGLSGVSGTAADQIVGADLANRGYTTETMYDPATMALNPEIAARPANFQTTTTRTGNPVTLGTMQASTSRAPVNPGPKAPWQQSAQYWKDLEAYNKAGGR